MPTITDGNTYVSKNPHSDVTIPQAPDAELAVLGALLLDQSISESTRARLKPSQFFVQSSRKIYEALLALDARGVKFDPVQLAEELRKAGVIDDVGGFAYVATLTDRAIRSDLEPSIDLVIEAHEKRRLWAVAMRAARGANNGSTPAEIIETMREAIEVEGAMPGVDVKAQIAWGDPQPIPDGLLPVPQLPVALIPAAFRGWLHDIATRLQVPLDFPAIPAIVAVASVIGNQVRIRPKAHDDWTITPNLWGAIVGRPGTMKSPAIFEAIKPLNRLVTEAKKEHKEALKTWKFEKEAAEIRRAAKRDEMKKAAKRGSNLEEFRDELAGDDTKEPTERRYTTNDATVEKYGELLNQNPNGLLIQRDELTGWLRSLDDEGRAKDRSFYLEAANGAGDYTYDRIGRGTLYIKSITTSIIGGIQPGPLQTYLRGTLGFGEGDDGLIQRFQMMTYPDLPPEWTYVDRWPDSEARNTAFDVFKRLATMPEDLNFERDDDDGGAAFIRFTPEAQRFFEEWLTDLMGDIRRGAFEHPALESHFIKYSRLMPALALIFELVNAAARAFEPFEPSVSIESAKLAAAWCQFLMAHAKRIYGLGIAATEIRARALAIHIQKGDVKPTLTEGFTARDVYLKHWAGLNTSELVAEPLEMLEYLGWIRGAFLSKGGRPTTVYQINPRVSEVRL